MSISKAAIMLVVFVILFSVFVSNISNMISTVDLNYERTTTTPLEYNVSEFTLSNKEVLGSDLRHLIWFIQISDLHISIFHDPTRIAELKEFCHLTLNAINPIVVLASGDLTDAKTADNIGSSQFVGEWQIYRKLLQDCGVQSKTVWLDIRGNHDNFNVPGLTSKENFYREYSVQGLSHPRSYMHQVTRDNQTYSFIGVDACLEPGPRRPFNFIGVLSRAELAHLRGLAAEARRRGSRHDVWFGHYPTSCILSPSGKGIRELMGSSREGLAYLCGHFHTFGGMVPNMYTLQKAGFLELELGDWKDNRLYRVAAIDHGIFSFIDVKHRDWPVILITNPKHSLFRIPLREPLQKIALSTHVRVLVFSLSPIKRVQVRVEAEDWRPCTHVEGPLYVAEWQPGLYARGVHHLQVYAVDDHNRERTLSQPFSLDETRTSFSILPRFALMCNISLVFQLVFGVTLVVSIVPLCILKFLHKVVRAGKCRKPRPPITVVRWWLRKLWILATVDRIFYPLVMYALYLTVGPWSVGEVIEGYIGFIFAWGTIVNGVYLPGSFTYAYGSLQMITFQIPLTLLLAHALDYRIRTYGMGKPCLTVSTLWQSLPFFALIALQIMYAYFFWLAYGTMAFLLGPLRTWSILLAAMLWYQVHTLPETCLQEAACLWSKHLVPSNEEDCTRDESTTVT